MCCLPTEKSNERINGYVAPCTWVLHFRSSETYLHVVLPSERPSFRSSHGLKMVRHSRSTITQLNPPICAVVWHQRVLSSILVCVLHNCSFGLLLRICVWVRLRGCRSRSRQTMACMGLSGGCSVPSIMDAMPLVLELTASLESTGVHSPMHLSLPHWRSFPG